MKGWLTPRVVAETWLSAAMCDWVWAKPNSRRFCPTHTRAQREREELTRPPTHIRHYRVIENSIPSENPRCYFPSFVVLNYLRQALDTKDLVLKTLLAHVQIRGLVREVTPYFETSDIRLLEAGKAALQDGAGRAKSDLQRE